MKKISIAFLALLLILVSALSSCAVPPLEPPDGGTQGGNEQGGAEGDEQSTTFEYELSEDGKYYLLTAVTELSGNELVIPHVYGEKQVREISENILLPLGEEVSGAITSITVPSTIAYIDSDAFVGATGVTTFNFNASFCADFDGSSTPLSEVGTEVEEVTVNVGKFVDVLPGFFLGFSSRRDSERFTEINFASDGRLARINPSAFYNCAGITSVSIPEGVTRIGENAFYGCEALERIELPKSIQNLGASAFFGCNALETAEIADLAAWCAVVFENETSNPASVAGSISHAGEVIETLTVPLGVLRIRKYAFSGAGLTGLNISVDTIEIHELAFSNNPLSSVTLHSGLKILGDSAFAGCKKLSRFEYNSPECLLGEGILAGSGVNSEEGFELVIGKSVKLLPTELYSSVKGAVGVTAVTLTPGGITEIPENAFDEIPGLLEIDLHEGIVSVGVGAFDACTELVERVDGVDYVGGWAILADPTLAAFKLREGTVGIADTAFAGLPLSEIDLTGVKHVGNGAFTDNTALRSLTVPPSLVTVGAMAFMNCSSLSTFTLPEGSNLLTVGADAFVGCQRGLSSSAASLEEWAAIDFLTVGARPVGSSGILLIDDAMITDLVIEDLPRVGAFSFCNISTLRSLTLKNVDYIGEGAFYRCSNLATVSVDSDTLKAGKDIFRDCKRISSVYYNVAEVDFGEYLNESGFLHNVGASVSAGTVFTFGKDVSDISFGILHPVHIAIDSGSRPGSYPNIVEIKFEEGSLLKSVSKSAFDLLYKLKTVTLPESVTEISDWAFYRCSALTSVNFPAGLKTIAPEAFKYCTSLQTIALPEGLEVMMNGCFDGCTSLSSLSIPSTVKLISGRAFHGCTALNIDLVIPEGVEGIGGWAFGNSAVRSVVIAKSVTYMEGDIFNGCTSLASAVLPEGLTEIPKNLFEGCTSLTDVTIPDSVTRISDNVFRNCSALERIVFPEALEYIGRSAFLGCVSITELVLPEGEWFINEPFPYPGVTKPLDTADAAALAEIICCVADRDGNGAVDEILNSSWFTRAKE